MTYKDIIMITHPQCGHCANAKKLLKDKIKSGRIKSLDLEKDKKALELSRKYNIRGVPTLLVGDEVKEKFSKCRLSRDGKKALCKNGNEIEEVEI